MFTKVLIPLDGSTIAEEALGPAADIARAAHAGLDLVLVHQPWAFSELADAAWQANVVNSERAYVASTAQELAKGASLTVSSTVLSALPVDGICTRAKEVGANLIVMTSHGRTGLSRSWLGSVAHGVIRQSRIPVLMLRPADSARRPLRRPPSIKRVLVTLDGSSLSEVILGPASALARAFDARLILLRVVEPIPLVLPEVVLPVRNMPCDDAATADAAERAAAELAEICKRLKEDGFSRVEPHVIVDDRVAKAILDFARSVSPSVIAMSTHGRGASRLFLGSVSDKVLRGSTRPMLLCRPDAVQLEPALIDEAGVASQLQSLGCP
jgi:nucleotide-binding universal stress UspA family protein